MHVEPGHTMGESLVPFTGEVATELLPTKALQMDVDKLVQPGEAISQPDISIAQPVELYERQPSVTRDLKVMPPAVEGSERLIAPHFLNVPRSGGESPLYIIESEEEQEKRKRFRGISPVTKTVIVYASDSSSESGPDDLTELILEVSSDGENADVESSVDLTRESRETRSSSPSISVRALQLASSSSLDVDLEEQAYRKFLTKELEEITRKVENIIKQKAPVPKENVASTSSSVQQPQTAQPQQLLIKIPFQSLHVLLPWCNVEHFITAVSNGLAVSSEISATVQETNIVISYQPVVFTADVEEQPIVEEKPSTSEVVPVTPSQPEPDMEMLAQKATSMTSVVSFQTARSESLDQEPQSRRKAKPLSRAHTVSSGTYTTAPETMSRTNQSSESVYYTPEGSMIMRYFSADQVDQGSQDGRRSRASTITSVPTAVPEDESYFEEDLEGISDSTVEQFSKKCLFTCLTTPLVFHQTFFFFCFFFIGTFFSPASRS